MKYALLAICLMLSFAASAQDRPEIIIDSIYNISYPWKKQIQKLGKVGLLDVSLLRITEKSTGKVIQRCRLTTNEVSVTGKSIKEHSAILDKDQLSYLIKQLSDMYIIGKSNPPRNYEEHTDVIGSTYSKLRISVYSDVESRWKFIIDLSPGFSWGKENLGIEKLIDLDKHLKTCLGFLEQ